MNYRHAFHAGNFADVVKHAVLSRILVHLRTKPAAFRVIDTHAGAGLYDLAGAEATPQPANGSDGIERLRRRASIGAASRASARALSRRRRSLNPARRAAGLSRLARARARAAAPAGPADRLRAGAAARRPRWRAISRGDRRSKAIAIDGWTALQRLCPAEGAARPGADRSAVRGRRTNSRASPRRSKPRTANGRPASICSGTRSRSAASRTLWRGALRRSGIGKILRAELELARRRDAGNGSAAAG